MFRCGHRGGCAGRYHHHHRAGCSVPVGNIIIIGAGWCPVPVCRSSCRCVFRSLFCSGVPVVPVGVPVGTKKTPLCVGALRCSGHCSGVRVGVPVSVKSSSSLSSSLSSSWRVCRCSVPVSCSGHRADRCFGFVITFINSFVLLCASI